MLDARRCISYLTIEHRGWIDRALRPLMGNWVFGCDVCQAVCPWQRFAVQSQETTFFPLGLDRAAPPLRQLLALTPAGFAAKYGGSALARAGRDPLVRNACVAAANGAQADCVPLLTSLLADPSPIVRGHAAWALGRLMGTAAEVHLSRRLAREPDQDVRQELLAALPSAPGD